MKLAIDESTASFLETAADDLQRQLGRTGAVERLALEEAARGIGLVAIVRIGQSEVEVRGSGGNLVTAYSDLRVALSQSALTTTFVQMMDATTT